MLNKYRPHCFFFLLRAFIHFFKKSLEALLRSSIPGLYAALCPLEGAVTKSPSRSIVTAARVFPFVCANISAAAQVGVTRFSVYHVGNIYSHSCLLPGQTESYGHFFVWRSRDSRGPIVWVRSTGVWDQQRSSSSRLSTRWPHSVFLKVTLPGSLGAVGRLWRTPSCFLLQAVTYLWEECVWDNTPVSAVPIMTEYWRIIIEYVVAWNLLVYLLEYFILKYFLYIGRKKMSWKTEKQNGNTMKNYNYY